MPQEFHVVLCYSCQTFQVHQVKKVSRWSCKLCGQKQSLLKEFGRGSARDCRHHVQKLNSRRGAMMQEQESQSLSLWKQMEENGDEDEEQRENERSQAESCWSKYLCVKEKQQQQQQDEEEQQQEEDWLASAQPQWKRRRTEEPLPEQVAATWKHQRTRKHSDQSSLKKPGTHPASKDCTRSPSPTSTIVRVSPVSRWLPFLSSSSQEQQQEEEEQQQQQQQQQQEEEEEEQQEKQQQQQQQQQQEEEQQQQQQQQQEEEEEEQQEKQQQQQQQQQQQEEEQQQQQQRGQQEQTCAGGWSTSPFSSQELTSFHRASLPRPSSMFDTGEDFDEFLPAAP